MRFRHSAWFAGAALALCLTLAAESSAQVKVSVKPDVVTSNVTEKSCKAKLVVTVTATDEKTKAKLFSHKYQTAVVTLPKNVEIVFPPPPAPPKVPNVTVTITNKAKFTGTEVSGSSKAQVKVGPPVNKTITKEKSFKDKVDVN
ncbi:MAG: hypothetical protein L0Y71_17780 [Gemmataceae bacterium]|nr:hypothetical protein [Gemmataceae bacterium]